MLVAVFTVAPFLVGAARPSVLQQPFAANSIWNLPIGRSARYVPAGLTHASAAAGLEPDADIIALTPAERPVDFLFCTDDWNRSRSRCMATDPGHVVLSAPLPAAWVIPGNNGHLSNTPNAGMAVLLPDNRTVAQTQPAARCTAPGPATSHWRFPDEDILGLGVGGAHGGSGLSAIGGTLRLGELVPGAEPIRHALKLEFDARLDYSDQSPYYRWPATRADSYAATTYGGKNPALRPGSLLALNASLEIGALGLETAPARALAWTLQNYGGYIVSDAAQSVYQLCVEYGTRGYVADEFHQAWGFPLSQPANAAPTPWARDVERLIRALSVVDSWDAATYQRVAASNGAEGAGGGAPLQPWIEPPTLGA